MIRRQGILVFALLVLLAFTLPVFAFAQNAFTDPIVPCSGVDCTVCDIAQLGQNILNTAVYLAVFLSAVLFAWAGWESLTAAGNAEKHHKAKSIFTNVAVGLIIILVGWLVVDTLIKTLTGDRLGRPWNRVCAVSEFEHFYA